MMLACVGLIGCGSATTGTPAPGVPTPEPGEPPPGVPADEGRRGLTYLPVRDAGYILERHDSLTLQLPGGNQLQLIDRTAYLRVSVLRDTTGSHSMAPGYQAIIVLDSIQAFVSGTPALPDSIIPARGTRWTGTLTPEGRLSGLKADRTTTIGDQVGSSLRSLFPTLPPGGAQLGMEWTDTIVVPVRADAFDATERALTSYRAVESDDARARNAIKLESRGSYERVGKGRQHDQPMEMTASGQRSAVHYLSPNGLVIAARGSDSGKMTITVPAVGQTVPVEQTGSYSITALRPPR